MPSPLSPANLITTSCKTVAVGVLVLISRIKAKVENGYKCKGTAPTKNTSKITSAPGWEKQKIPILGYALSLHFHPHLKLGKWAHMPVTMAIGLVAARMHALHSHYPPLAFPTPHEHRRPTRRWLFFGAIPNTGKL
jgi:hypothetical protein